MLGIAHIEEFMLGQTAPRTGRIRLRKTTKLEEFMATILAILSGVVNIGCLLYVAFKMLEEEGALKALLGLLCCQLYAYIWGWLKLEAREKMVVMVVWTVSMIIAGIAQSMLASELTANMNY